MGIVYLFASQCHNQHDETSFKPVMSKLGEEGESVFLSLSHFISVMVLYL